jgi:hypothetical protein
MKVPTRETYHMSTRVKEGVDIPVHTHKTLEFGLLFRICILERLFHLQGQRSQLSALLFQLVDINTGRVFFNKLLKHVF